MPVIVTATDFSDAATNAVHYACRLAMATQCSVTVIHSFVIPVAFNDMPMPVVPLDEGRRVAEESMERLFDDLQKTYHGLVITTKVTYGEITDSLQEYAEEHKPWMMVIGNSTNEDTPFWLGSNLLTALRELACMVLAVPLNSAYSEVKNICYACDYKHILDKFPAQQLVTIVKATGAQLHVLNVDHNNRGFGTETPAEATVLQQLLQNVKPQYHFINSEDTDQGIQAFVETHGMNWLVVMPHKHGFFEGLFHKSHTKAMVRMSHVPILALHEKE